MCQKLPKPKAAHTAIWTKVRIRQAIADNRGRTVIC